MDHVVYVTRSSKELEGLFDGGRSVIVRGSRGRKVPYGCVAGGDRLFFATGTGRNVVKAAAAVDTVYDSPPLSGIEPECLIAEHMGKLRLTDVEMTKWSQKKFLTLIGVSEFCPVVPFTIAARGSGEADDWLVLGNIDEVIE
jgi:hypothetical protein